jgi:hypothetical protein
VVILLALLGNAVICGALANPHNRYGSRLIWLAPLTLLLVPVRLWSAQARVADRWRVAAVPMRVETRSGP